MFPRLSPVHWIVIGSLGIVLLIIAGAVAFGRDDDADKTKDEQTCNYVRAFYSLILNTEHNDSVLTLRAAIRRYNADPSTLINAQEDDFLRYLEVQRAVVSALDDMSPPQELMEFHGEIRTAAVRMRDQAMDAYRLAMSGNTPDALKVIEGAEEDFARAISQAGANHPEAGQSTHCFPELR